MIQTVTQTAMYLADATKQNLGPLEMMACVLFGFFILNNVLLGGRLCVLGIIPRRLFGLPGIVFAPLLHANFNHLFFNLIPFLVLSNFLLLQGWDYFMWVSIFITLMSGFLTWCFAKPGIHLGASGLITGYWALLVMNIYYQGTFLALVLGALSIYYFAGIFFGIFPTQRGVSWEGHFFGLLSGVMVHYVPEVLEIIIQLIQTTH